MNFWPPVSVFTLPPSLIQQYGPRHRRRPLVVRDHTLPGFCHRIGADDTRTFFVRVRRKLGMVSLPLGTATELTAAEARVRAAAESEAAKAERRTGPLFRDMRVADFTRADVRRWFDSMSGAPGTANRALPVLSVMMTQAELWDVRPQGSNPCRNMRRHRMKPRERFLSIDELKRLGFVLDHADDRQAAAAIRLPLFTGARSSEITGLQWGWIRGTRAVLRDAKTGPRTLWLGPEAIAVLAALPREEGAARVFPEPSPRRASTRSGSGSGRRPDCTGCTSTMPAIPTPRRAS